MEQKEGKYIPSKFSKYLLQIHDNVYLMGRGITKATDKIIPGKMERRDYAMRTRVNQLLDGELPDEELTKLGLQTSGLKGGYMLSLGLTGGGIATLNPIIVLGGLTSGALSRLHQNAMSKNLKNQIYKMTGDERKELKEFLKDKDTYQFRDVLYQKFGF